MPNTEEIDPRAELEAAHGKVYTTAELQEQFIVQGFLLGVVVVVRKSDNRRGVMQFSHMPRYYFDFVLTGD